MQREVTRTTLAVLSIGALIGTSIWIMRPFLVAMVWATMIVVATWPLMIALQRRLRGRRAPAIALLAVVMLVVLVLPFWVAANTFTQHSGDLGAWTKSLLQVTIPPPPAFVDAIPLIGPKMSEIWQQAATEGWQELSAHLQPYLGKAARWLAAEVGTLGLVVFQSALTIVIAVVLYANGEEAADSVRRFGRRLAGERGEHVVQLAGQTVRGVALGVVVTALAQSLLGGLGLAVAGIPLAGLLTMLMLFLCLAQIGPFPVLIPAIVWLFWAGENVSGSVLLVWSIVIGPVDNILRPVLIKKGADLPLVLIFAGVIGGLLSFGLLGLFVGPVVLAVSFRLLQEWVREADIVESSGASVPSAEQAVAGKAGEGAPPADGGPASPPSS